ncbi:MAG: TraB/GumN family protein [Luteimonas sp.]
MRQWILASLFVSAAFSAHAQEVLPADIVQTDDIRTEAAVVVSGSQPGPGLWKVVKGEHVLWVLGTQSPLPKRMQWRSGEVEQALAESQEVIYAPRIGMSVDTGGIFRSLFLLPKLYGARKNPDGKTLREVLPADLYARWLPLRQQYLGRGGSAERMRPLFAAGELWEEALDDNGLVSSGIIGPVIARAVKDHGLRETRPSKSVKVTDPKALLAEVEHEQLDDAPCMDATLRQLEGGPERIRELANAWATGDLAQLRALTVASHNRACADAALLSPALRKRGAEGMEADLRKTWLAAAEKALAGNTASFALLPIENLLSTDGYLAKLAARGYEVIPPE